MSQADYDIANQAGAAFRADLNNHLAAIVSNNSGATEPSTPYAYQWWADTTTGLLKIRNAANSGWVSLFSLSAAFTAFILTLLDDADAETARATLGVSYASASQAQAGTDATKVVTPDNLGATVLGIGQTWQTPARSLGVTYTNSTGRPILINYAGTVSTTSFLTVVIDGNGRAFSSSATVGNTVAVTGVLIPNGSTYSITLNLGTISASLWAELR